MAAKETAGLLMYRKKSRDLEYFLIHPGGPYWAHKDIGSWSMPKGMVEPGESTLDAAMREFHEETGLESTGPYTSLGHVKTRGGKILYAWAFAGDWDPADGIVSNIIKIEFPYKSGRQISVPEADRGAWWSSGEAMKKINPSQVSLLNRADALLQ